MPADGLADLTLATSGFGAYKGVDIDLIFCFALPPKIILAVYGYKQ